ncbi:MAG: hypothetical protein AMS16_00410 [Planctomycetes bacterium DG_58]|nr:MAG: hypothetical protein AMS16_00410 [Planctomycetes bacterium DG_58]
MPPQTTLFSRKQVALKGVHAFRARVASSEQGTMFSLGPLRTGSAVKSFAFRYEVLVALRSTSHNSEKT